MSHESLRGRRVLFISYNGMLDPLGQSQVIPYLRQLSRLGISFTLLSFERSVQLTAKGPAGLSSMRNSLAEDGIEWYWLSYHQTPSLLATMFDVANGVRVTRRLVKQNRIELVHARSHIPATIALAVKRRFPVKFIFDVRGLMAEEYVDANHWKKNSLPYRLTKNMERRALATADGVVTLTEKIWAIIKDWEPLNKRDGVVHQVVPCCADLNVFHFSEYDRQRRREELALHGKFVFTYSGSIDGWYLTEEMADFFVTALKDRDENHVLWLTPTRHDRIRSLMQARGVRDNRYSIVAVAPANVASYLSASDVGVAFIKRCFSKLASSPTKYAEYLACGLPLVINAGIGDCDALITEENAGVLLQNLNKDEYRGALRVIDQFVDNPTQTRTAMRKIAERLFDVSRVGVERYAELYEAVLHE